MARLNSGGCGTRQSGTLRRPGSTGGDRMRDRRSAPGPREAQPARYRNGPNENAAADKLLRSGC